MSVMELVDLELVEVEEAIIIVAMGQVLLLNIHHSIINHNNMVVK